MALDSELFGITELGEFTIDDESEIIGDDQDACDHDFFKRTDGYEVCNICGRTRKETLRYILYKIWKTNEIWHWIFLACFVMLAGSNFVIWAFLIWGPPW